jgi:hypothetical protein
MPVNWPMPMLESLELAFRPIRSFAMTRNKSHGRHGGNRGSRESRDDDNPNRQPINTDVESEANNRNQDRAGDHKLGVMGESDDRR